MKSPCAGTAVGLPASLVPAQHGAAFAASPGPLDVDVVAPETILGDAGGLLGFVPSSVRITYSDGTQRDVSSSR